MSKSNAEKKLLRIDGSCRRNEDMCLVERRRYGCTLPKGHSGPHIAFGAPFEVCAMWANKKKPAPELDYLLLKAQDLAEAMRKHNLTHLGQLQLR